MSRFAYVRKFCIYAKFAYVCKSGHVYTALDGDVPRRPSNGVYISQLIIFAQVCSHVDDFNTRNKCLTA